MTVEYDDKDAFIIRNAVTSDLPALVEFLAKLALHVSGDVPQVLKEAERTRLMNFLAASLKDEDKRVAVAEVAGVGLVGMGYIYVWRSQGVWEQAGDVEFRSGMIDDIWVEPEFRKLGVFTAMLRELVAFAESRGTHELILEYSVSNKEADATWTRLGFKPTGVRVAAFTDTVKEELSKRK